MLPQFPVHPCSGTSNLLAASPGLISHPPARRRFPKLRELLERSYYSAASRRLATPLSNPSSWLPVWNSLEKPAAGGGCLPCPPRSQPAPRTRPNAAHGSGARIHPRQETQRTTRSALIPSRVFSGASRARLCRVKNESLFLACPG